MTGKAPAASFARTISENDPIISSKEAFAEREDRPAIHSDPRRRGHGSVTAHLSAPARSRAVSWNVASVQASFGHGRRVQKPPAGPEGVRRAGVSSLDCGLDHLRP